jgi:hypothetical protein
MAGERDGIAGNLAALERDGFRERALPGEGFNRAHASPMLI